MSKIIVFTASQHVDTSPFLYVYWGYCAVMVVVLWEADSYSLQYIFSMVKMAIYK